MIIIINIITLIIMIEKMDTVAKWEVNLKISNITNK